jgi:L-fucose isomerase-like protein
MAIGVIVGNRDFFPDRLVSEGRDDILKLFAETGVEPVILNETDSKLGAVETWQHARRCADLFRANRDKIEGVLVCLPNFGDEKGVADTLHLAELNVPVLVQAYPDDLTQLSVERRRDAFCGKVSVCNNLRQYGIPFSLTRRHTVRPLTDSFREDFKVFLAVCKVVRGLRKARIGAIGARPNAFNTTRYSEKLLQAAGISVNTIDLSEVFGNADRIPENDPRVTARLEQIKAYAPSGDTPARSLTQMSKSRSSFPIGWRSTTSRRRPSNAGHRCSGTSASIPAPS